MWYSNLEKTFISWHILHHDISSTNIDTLVPLLCKRVKTHSIEVCCLSTVASVTVSTGLPDWSSSSANLWLSNVLERISQPSCEQFKWQTFPTVKRKHFFMNILCIESFCPLKKHNRTLLFSHTILKHGRHFDYWNQPLNMRICYLDCHEAELCYYLVIHIENLLCPSQMFYFHLWLSHIHTYITLMHG
jgi:hypothetical protein